MRYQIIQAEAVNQLESFVNNEIKHDWEPTGGLIVFLRESGDTMLAQPRTVFAQAMITHKPEPPPKSFH